MTDMVSRIRARPHDAPMPTEYLLDDAADHIETLEAALRTIQSVIPGYLKQKMTAEDFALIVIGAVDNGKVNKALEKGETQ